MRTETGKILGSLRIQESFQLNGVVTGTIQVSKAAHFRLNGVAMQDIVIEVGGTAEINGTVYGDVINQGGHVIVRGVIQGALLTHSGRTETSPDARIGLKR